MNRCLAGLSFLFFWVFTGVVFPSHVRAAGEIPGLEAPQKRFQSSDGKRCYLYQKYVVLSVDSGIGSDTTAFLREAGSDARRLCEPSGKRVILDIKNEDAEFFSGLWSHFLFVISGRGTDRNLMIYDLDSEKLVYQSNFAEPFVLNPSGKLVFYTADDFNPEVKSCPGVPQGQWMGFDVQVSLNLKTLKLTHTGEVRCTSRQGVPDPS